ncbi:MAG: mechanosensitive ion channel family protein [Gemmatimonadetes bacterium]|nr:mechanosensitive ion channel family protein [Gemmatimonadota bacterium]
MFDTNILGNSLRQWSYAVLVALGLFLTLRFLVRVAHARLAAFAARTATLWDDIIVHALGRTQAFFIPLLCLAVGSAALGLPPAARSVVRAALVLGVLFQGGLWLSAGFMRWLQGYVQRRLTADRAAATTMTAVAFGVKALLWSIILLVALDNVGVNVTTLVTGLGVGGVAVALAVQNILGDLFASLSIVLDKPFVIGDFIIVDELLGSVEHIGLKTTRVRSLWGEQVVFSNSDLLKSRLRNFGRMAERRVSFQLGVTYQTSRTGLKKIPGIIQEAIEAQPRTRFDRSHFKAYGDFALTFESVYYVLSPEYNMYMDIQQAINLRLHQRFEDEGIEFAYPTQTVYLERTGTRGT